MGQRNPLTRMRVASGVSAGAWLRYYLSNGAAPGSGLDGTYRLSVAVYNELLRQAYDHHKRAYTFRGHTNALGERYGLIQLEPTWRHRPNEEDSKIRFPFSPAQDSLEHD